MFYAVYLFFTDPAYCRAALAAVRAAVASSSIGGRVSSVLAAAGVLIVFGVIPLAKLGETFGDVGWWAGAACVAYRLLRKGGNDTLETLSNLTPDQAQELQQQLQSAGVLKTAPELASAVVAHVDPRQAAQLVQKAKLA